MTGFKEELYIGCTMGDLAIRALSRYPDRVVLATED